MTDMETVVNASFGRFIKRWGDKLRREDVEEFEGFLYEKFLSNEKKILSNYFWLEADFFRLKKEKFKGKYYLKDALEYRTKKDASEIVRVKRFHAPTDEIEEFERMNDKRFKKLTREERLIFTAYFKWGFLHHEIGAALGVSKRRVGQIIEAIILKLSKNGKNACRDKPE